MRKRSLAIVGSLVLLATGFSPHVSRAQTVRARILEGLDLREGTRHWRIRVRFNLPVRVLRHSPPAQGATVRVAVRPIRASRAQLEAVRRREVLVAPTAFPLPLDEVEYEGNAAGGPFLNFRFSRTVRFRVLQGNDFRSVVLEIPRRLSSGNALSLAEALMEEGRRAMTAGQLDRAVAIFTKILSLPENPHSREAKELLGLAHERKGQLAHAKAEYEDYLRRYPQSEGAERVRQRLAALLTARRRPPPTRRLESSSRRVRLDLFGSLFTSYRREVRDSEGGGSSLVDHSLLNDFHLEARLRTDTYTARTQASGGYRYDFLPDGSNEPRLSTLFLEATHRDLGTSASLGRRFQSSAGVLGRYDGLRVSQRFRGVWEAAVVAGFPVASSHDVSLDTSERFLSVSLDRSWFEGRIDTQLYAVQQVGSGLVERRAVGAELRYAGSGRFVFGAIDYDLAFGALNAAELLGNWQLDPKTMLNFLADWRRSPPLSLSNALQGELLNDLSDLADTLSEGEIRKLADERTPHALTLSAGASRRLSDRLELALDLSATHLSGTPASGSLEATDGTGLELSYFAQLITADLLTRGDAGFVGLRFFQGDRIDAWTLTLDERIPLARRLRVNPKLTAQFRRQRDSADELALSSALRLEFEIADFHLDLEAGARWTQRAEGAGSEFGYTTLAEVRLDF